MKIIRLMLFLIFVGCVVNSKAQTEKKSNFSYRPNLQSIANMDSTTAYSYITYWINDCTDMYDNKGTVHGKPSDVVVLGDRIEMQIKKQNVIIKFSDIIDYYIEARTNHKISDDGSVWIRFSSELILGRYTFIFKGEYSCDPFAKALFFVQTQQQEKRYNSQLILFEPLAAQYRELKVKPTVSEEQRKYIVQANGFNEQKMYEKAIELYKKAIEVNQTAFPAAYSNLALLSAQVNKFDAAIYYMKKYLMLEPEADDARSAQDKIYLWEAQLGK